MFDFLPEITPKVIAVIPLALLVFALLMSATSERVPEGWQRDNDFEEDEPGAPDD